VKFTKFQEIFSSRTSSNICRISDHCLFYVVVLVSWFSRYNIRNRRSPTKFRGNVPRISSNRQLLILVLLIRNRWTLFILAWIRNKHGTQCGVCTLMTTCRPPLFFRRPGNTRPAFKLPTLWRLLIMQSSCSFFLWLCLNCTILLILHIICSYAYSVTAQWYYL
jgi:hypothetical protein